MIEFISDIQFFTGLLCGIVIGIFSMFYLHISDGFAIRNNKE
mgnify:CR=1 FL=1